MPISRVHLRGHPIHPMLVTFPLAFLASAAPADAVFLLHGGAYWAWLGLLLNAAGAGLGLVAAAVGTIDLFGVPGVRRRIAAWSHAVAALVLLGLATANAWLRWSDPQAAVWPLGLALSSTQLILVGVAGWLGGTLSFKFGIGMYGRHERR